MTSATGSLPVLSMRGDAGAAACEGDACLVPGVEIDAAGQSDAGSPAADLAHLRAAIDSGQAI